MIPPHREELFRRVLTRTVTGPVSLFLATTGALLTVSPVAWPLGIAVLAGELLYVWAHIRDPEVAREVCEEVVQDRWRQQVTRLEQLAHLLDRETSAALTGILEAQERLLGLYGEHVALLPQSRAELTSLLDHCLSLAEKRHQLQSYLTTFRGPEVVREEEQLRARIGAATDPVTRQLYEQALEQKRQQAASCRSLQDAISRIDGQLAAVRCTFDNLLTKVVRLHSADAVAAESMAEPVFSELNQLTARVAALEVSLSETLQLRGAV